MRRLHLCYRNKAFVYAYPPSKQQKTIRRSTTTLCKRVPDFDRHATQRISRLVASWESSTIQNPDTALEDIERVTISTSKNHKLLHAQQSLSDHQNTKMSKINFLDLPIEIKLNVLSCLPTKEIQKARQVSKHMQELIDEKDNNSSLVKASRSGALETVHAIYDGIFNFDPATTDLLALHRRFACLGKCRQYQMEVLIRAYLHRLELEVVNDEAFIHEATALVMDIADSQRCTKDYFVSFTSAVHGDLYEDLKLSPQTMADFYDRVKEYRARQISPPRALGPYFHGLKRKNHERLCEILQVPVIPGFARDVFHYGVKSMWAYGKVIRMLSGETVSDMQLAAIREEVFLQ